MENEFISKWYNDIALRANNNYGDWSGETEAQAIIEHAVSDVCQDITEQFIDDYKHSDDYLELLKDMTN